MATALQAQWVFVYVMYSDVDRVANQNGGRRV